MFVSGFWCARRIDNYEIMFVHRLTKESREAVCSPGSGFYSLWFELIENACKDRPFRTEPVANAVLKAVVEPR